MAKIVEATRLTTAQKISGEQRDIAGLEQEIASLKAAQIEHLGDDTPDRALQIGERIVAAERGLQIRRERLAAFRARARKERISAREKAKAEHLKETERRLADWAAVMTRGDRVLADLTAFFAEAERAHKAAFAEWSVDFPPVRFFATPMNLFDRIASVLNIPVHVARIRLPELSARLGSLGEPATRLVAETVESIKDWPLPEDSSDDDDDGPAAAPIVPLAPETARGVAALGMS
jgi:hypothetical protein